MDKELFEFYKSALSGEISTPLCAAYKSAWRKCGDDKGMLISLAMRQQSIPMVATYAYQNKSLTKDYIKSSFSDYINGYTLQDCDGVNGYTYGMYVDWDYENDLVVDKDVVSVMWTVGANIVVPTSKCPTIYISNRSNVHLVGEGFNTVHVKLFDKSVLTVEDLDENSEVVVYQYSDDAAVNAGKYCFGRLKVFKKRLIL